ncbi:MAG: PH domain-containing protein [Clostridiales Family XIII bacterium]|jgi:membrane protein YdbS with pleckstrin-like domain|nr:PH domain-containing protein [Clostridiales Family XIII bacterium]
MRTEPTEKLNPRARSLWRIHAAIATAIAGAVLIVPAALLFRGDLAPLWPVAAGISVTIALFLIFVVFLPAIRYKRWRYRISDDEIAIRRGILIVTHTVVPMIKIQYTDTMHGPIMRALHLAAVRIMTAGGTESIPGLPPEEADEMRDRITRLVKTVKENI